MGTKEKLLTILEEKKGVYFSGEELAEMLAVSRTAVWKAVNRLRCEGYEIDAVPNRGYRLGRGTDILSLPGIKRYLEPVCAGLKITVFPSVDSTNTRIREQAAAGAPEGLVVISGSQTKGKGRMGRSFFSPADTGVYISLLLRPPHYSAQEAVKLTTMAAVAACEAIEKVSDQTAQIKWVNDIFIGGKKAAGILTEASFDLENNCLDHAVPGIGFNVYPPKGGFPKELESVAGAIFNELKEDGKNRLAAEFLNRFMTYYSTPEISLYPQRYRARCFVLGKAVRVLSASSQKEAVALDVDEDCRLIVQYEDGTIEHLSSGEISVRLR